MIQGRTKAAVEHIHDVTMFELILNLHTCIISPDAPPRFHYVNAWNSNNSEQQPHFASWMQTSALKTVQPRL